MTKQQYWQHLTQESVLILLLGYVLLLGGSYTALAVFELRRINLILIGLTGAIWLLVRSTRDWAFPSTVLDLPLLAYFSVHVLTALSSTDPRRSAIYVWLLGFYILVFYLFVDLLRHGLSAKLLVKTVLIVGAIILGLSLTEAIRWFTIRHAVSGWPRALHTSIPRIQAPVGDPNWLAAVLNLLWPFALTQLWDTKDRLLRALLVVWLMVASALLYLSTSQGGWLGTVAGLVVLALLSGSLRRHLGQLVTWFNARSWRRVVGGLIAVLLGTLLVGGVVDQLPHLLGISGVKPRFRLWGAAWRAFRSSPIWGTGPFTYGDSYLLSRSVPPARLYGVAHSYPINLAAESGLLGLAALGWVTVVLTRRLLRGIGSLLLEDHPVRAGAAASLVGCAVHSQFDSVEILPIISLLLAMTVAILQSPDDDQRGEWGIPTWTLPLSWILLMATAIWSLNASAPFARGVTAADTGRWEEAALLLDRASRRDPALAHYHVQAGYAHGMLAAEGDPEHLDRSIKHYQAAAERFPDYALNAAHLGVLHRQAGHWQQALHWMQRAVDLAPRSALFTLNLGHLYERLDREALAKHWYLETLEQTPNLAHAAFWRSNPLRVAVAEPYVRSDHSARSQEDSNLAQECLAAGREALSVDRYEVALTAFECALESQPNSIKARRGRAEAYAALGRYAEAERELHKAQLSGGSPLDELHTAGALAQIQYDRGDITEGINILESAIDRAQRSVMHGKVVRWSRCGWLLFARRDLGAHLLPQLTTITVTDEMVDWILLLGRYYEEVGDVPAATRVYSQLLDAVPGCDAARRRLISIGEVDSD